MNNSILKIYRNLPELQRKAMKERYPDSPKMLAFLDFLDHIKGEKFTAIQAIQFLYKEELSEGLGQDIAINRFYKLRKKLDEELSQASGISTENTGQHPVIREYHQAVKLIDLNQPADALKKLKQIYPDAERDNLFEYMPDICEQLIYAGQIASRYRDIHVWFRRWEKANILLRDLNKAKYHSRMAFIRSTLNRYSLSEPHMLVLRQLATRYKNYPRFQAIYHYTCLAVGSRSMAKSPQSLGKHIKALEKILGSQPGIPWVMISEAYYLDNEFSLRVNKANFSISKGQYRTALQEMSAAVELAFREPMLRRRLSPTLLVNKLRLEIINEFYSDALRTCRELLDIEKKHGTPLQIYAEMGRIYIYGYPDIKVEEREELYKNLDLFISEALKTGREFDAAEVHGVKAILLFQQKKYKEALKIYRKDLCQQYFRDNEFDLRIMDNFFERTNPEELLKEIDKKIHQSPGSLYLVFHKMLKRSLEPLLEKS